MVMYDSKLDEVMVGTVDGEARLVRLTAMPRDWRVALQVHYTCSSILVRDIKWSAVDKFSDLQKQPYGNEGHVRSPLVPIVFWLTEMNVDRRADIMAAVFGPSGHRKMVDRNGRPKKRASKIKAQQKQQHDEEEEKQEEEEEEKLAIEKLLGSRDDDASGLLAETEYLVKWVGYSTKDNSWEPRENLGSEASTLIKELIKAKSAVKDRRVAKAAAAEVGANDQHAAPSAKRAAPPTKQVQKKAKAAVNQTPRIVTVELNCPLVCSIEQDGHMKA
jgi:hypothetical protein